MTSNSHLYSAHASKSHAVAQMVEALLYKPEGRGFDSSIVSLEFFIELIVPVTLWLWGRLST